MIIGYMRPCQDDINLDYQSSLLKDINCDLIFSEDHFLPKKRVELESALNELSDGDKLVVKKLFILGDSPRHLLKVMETIESKGAYLISIKESIDTSSESDERFSHTLKHLVSFQSDIISEKTKEGLIEAKQKGSTPGRPRKPDKNVRRAIDMYESKRFSLAEIRDETGISKSTLYRYLENSE